MLNKKINDLELTKIGNTLKSEKHYCLKLWVFYYLPNMDINKIAWATTHFTPKLELHILGSTENEDSLIKQISSAEGLVLGKWTNEQIAMGAIFTLFKDGNGDLRLQVAYKDGSKSVTNVIQRTQQGKKRLDYNNSHGEYYIIEENGNLGLYGVDGKYGEAQILK